MCTVKETEKIIHDEALVIIKEVSLSPIAKTLGGILAMAMLATIGFTAERIYSIQETINLGHKLIKAEVLPMIIQNTATIVKTEQWIKIHNVEKLAILKEYDLRVNQNKLQIATIINTKTDNRWRRRDEIADNKNKELIHATIIKEAIHLKETMDERCHLINIRIENMENDYDEFKDDYYEFHARTIQFMKNK